MFPMFSTLVLKILEDNINIDQLTMFSQSLCISVSSIQFLGKGTGRKLKFGEAQKGFLSSKSLSMLSNWLSQNCYDIQSEYVRVILAKGWYCTSGTGVILFTEHLTV